MSSADDRLWDGEWLEVARSEGFWQARNSYEVTLYQRNHPQSLRTPTPIGLGECGDFRGDGERWRTIQEVDEVEAELKDGVLSIILPESDEFRRRRVVTKEV